MERTQSSIIVMALCLLPALLSAQPIKKREMEQLVEEYCTPETTTERRDAIAGRLAGAPPKSLGKLLARSLKSESTREGALALGARLETPGLYRAAKKYIDGGLERPVVAAILAGADKGAEDFVIERWKTAELESPSFTIADEALRTHYVSAKAVRSLHEWTGNEKLAAERRERIPAILKFQMDLTDTQVERLDREFAALLEQFRLMTRPFEPSGEDLLARTGWELGFGGEGEADLVKRYRGKYLIEPGGVLRLPNITLKTFTMRMWVLVLEGDGASAGLMMKGGSFVGPRLEDGSWLAPPSIRQGTAPAKPLAWTEMVFKLAGANLSVSAGGVALAATNQYGTQCNGLFFGAGQSKLLIGVVDYHQE